MTPPSARRLRQLYIEQRLSVHVIGERFGVDGKTVWRWLVKMGIPRRRPGRVPYSPKPKRSRLGLW